MKRELAYVLAQLAQMPLFKTLLFRMGKNHCTISMLHRADNSGYSE